MEGWRSSKNMRGIVVENVTVRKPRERNPISILPSHYPSEHWLLFRRIDQYRSAHDSCRQFPKRIAKWSRRHAVRARLQPVKGGLVTHGARRVPIRLSPARANFQEFIRRASAEEEFVGYLRKPLVDCFFSNFSHVRGNIPFR